MSDKKHTQSKAITMGKVYGIPAPPSRAAPPPVSVEKSIEEAADSYVQNNPYLHVRVDADWYRSTNEYKAFLAGAEFGQRRERDRWRHDIDVGDVIKAQEENTRLQAQVKAATEALEFANKLNKPHITSAEIYSALPSVRTVIANALVLLREGGKQKGDA